ncbi:hypothetical protein [Erythrobacter phage vB_EliS-L02]|nr:hypothetical protein [Erythrobacter phage vB_EliS-L02]
MRDVEEPITVEVEGPGRLHETKTTHPSFGQVYVGRRSGHTALYGSDFIHNNHIVLTIAGSELHRNLSRDWHFERGKKIEIAMSEAQWATLVSSLNMGGGVPCTIEWHGEPIPRLPLPKNRADQFSKEMQEDFADAIKALDTLLEEIDGLKVSQKKKDEIKGRAQRAKASITSSAPFVAEQFGEHMENVVEAAKVEVHGYTQNLLTRAGIASIAGENDPLQLEDDTDD